MADNEWLPTDRLYDVQSYVWVRQDADSGQLTLGLGSPQIASFGDLVYLNLVKPGLTVTRGDVLGSVEAAKMTGEILSPVSGTIMDRNEAALKNPRLVSDDPYEAGWLFTIQPTSFLSERRQLHNSSSLLELLPEDLRGPQTLQ